MYFTRFLFIVSFLIVSTSSVTFSDLVEPDLIFELKIDTESRLYKSFLGKGHKEELGEILREYDYHRSQASFYEMISIILRGLIVVCSLICSLILALYKTEKTRKIALILSIIIATIPVAEGQFDLSDRRQSSWQTSIALKRIAIDSKRDWENLIFSQYGTDYNKIEDISDLKEDSKIFSDFWYQIHKQRRQIIDQKLDVFLRPVEPPVVKQGM